MAEINASIDFDRHLFRQDIAGSKAHAAMLAEQGIIAADDAATIARGSRHDPGRDRGRHVHVSARARRHPYERGVAARRADRPGRRAAAHGALAQRPGRDRFPALRARHDRRARRAARRLSAALAEKALEHAGDRDAGLHASADRAAGDVRPPPAGLCRDGGARPRPLRRCARAAQRIARSARRRSPAPRFRSTAT